MNLWEYAHYDVTYFDSTGVEIGRNYYFCRPPKTTQRQLGEAGGCQNLVADVVATFNHPLPNHPVPNNAAFAVATYADIRVLVTLPKPVA